MEAIIILAILIVVIIALAFYWYTSKPALLPDSTGVSDVALDSHLVKALSDLDKWTADGVAYHLSRTLFAGSLSDVLSGQTGFPRVTNRITKPYGTIDVRIKAQEGVFLVYTKVEPGFDDIDSHSRLLVLMNQPQVYRLFDSDIPDAKVGDELIRMTLFALTRVIAPTKTGNKRINEIYFKGGPTGTMIFAR